MLQRTHSSAQPERCSAISVRTKTDSSTKSRSLETSRLLAATPSNPSAAATCSRSIGKVVPARAAAPRGRTFSRRRQSARRLAVARELLDVGQEVMRRQDRLGALQVGVAGQDHVAMPLGGRHQGPLQGQRAARRSGRGRRGPRA